MREWGKRSKKCYRTKNVYIYSSLLQGVEEKLFFFQEFEIFCDLTHWSTVLLLVVQRMASLKERLNTETSYENELLSCGWVALNLEKNKIFLKLSDVIRYLKRKRIWYFKLFTWSKLRQHSFSWNGLEEWKVLRKKYQKLLILEFIYWN